MILCYFGKGYNTHPALNAKGSAVKLTFFTRSAVGQFAIAVAFMLLSQIALAETKTLHVKMANTPIFSEPSMESSKIATAQAGDQLDALEDAGRFHKVRTAKGEIGYVPRMNVTDRKPTPAPAPQDKGGDGDAELDDLVGSLGGEWVAKLEEASSSHSIRGKMSIVKRTAIISRAETEKSVSEMEKFTVSSDDVKKFRREGGLDVAD